MYCIDGFHGTVQAREPNNAAPLAVVAVASATAGRQEVRELTELSRDFFGGRDPDSIPNSPAPILSANATAQQTALSSA